MRRKQRVFKKSDSRASRSNAVFKNALSATKRVATVLMATAVVGFFLLTSSEAMAKGPAPSGKAKVTQVIAQEPSSRDRELQRLDKVSTIKIRGLLRDTEPLYRIDNQRSFGTAVRIDIDGQAVVSMIIINKRTKKMEMTVSPGTIINLSELARLYKKATGKEMKYVRLAVEVEQVPGEGTVVTFYAVPQNTPTEDLTSGIPIHGASKFMADGEVADARLLTN